MNELEKAIAKAFTADGSNKEANKAYLEFIKANFIIPIEKNSDAKEPEVLYLEENGQIFLPVFTNMSFFNQWVYDISDKIQILHLTGVNLLKGLGENVFVSLNIGSDLYKEFNPSELARMRSMVLKLFN
ncbi:SseB family protein [Legionella nagasakiensis]|uniref:SseB family protein n=1 Tax=Legionella nagasakiensis TaxID=535290 RepID=UPI001055BB35|nr:SseB family protein [Legionella nagasakiensis]